MKMVKSLLLASVAGFAASAGAQAADLPVKAKPVEYVKVCSLYGAGFFYLPGTETCLKIGGYAFLEVDAGPGGGTNTQRMNGNTALHTRSGDYYFARGRLDVNFDARTQTEYGVLRSFFEINTYQQTSNGDYNAVLTTNTNNAIPFFAFVQFAGFTLGKAVPINRPDLGGSPLWTSAWVGGFGDMGAAQTGTLQAAYTAEFGNGAKLTVGVQDPSQSRGPMYDTLDNTTSPFFAVTSPSSGISWQTSRFGGTHLPDGVANFQINQAWGGFSIAGIVRQMNASYYQTVNGGTVTELNGAPADKIGWGVTGALEIKNIPTGTGDRVQFYGSYSQGIQQLVSSTGPFNTLISIAGSTTLPGAYQSLAYSPILDSVWTGGTVASATTRTDQHLTTFFGGAAGYEHYWIPARLRTSVFGGVMAVRYDDFSKAALCTAFARNTAGVAAGGGQALAGSNCNFDLNIWTVGTRTVWTVVPGFDLIAEPIYTFYDTKLTGTVTPTASDQKPQAVYELKRQGQFSGMLRAIRTF